VPQNDDIDRLVAIAGRAAEVAAWHQFGRYLDQRARGLRRGSMEAVKAFAAAAMRWEFDQRVTFVRWLSQEAEGLCDKRLLIPHDLLTGLVAPTVREWRSRQPQSSMASYLSGKYCEGDDTDPPPLEAFRRSVALDPDFQPARRAFIDWVTAHAENNQHELPCHGYLGDAGEDVRDLAEARMMLAGVRHPLWRESIGIEVDELLEAARAWEAYSRSGEAGFAQWCRTHDGPVRFADASRESSPRGHSA
jgi:hypothetical protein